MTRTMRDGIRLNNIPVAGTEIVAVYANGKFFATPADVTHRFGSMPVVWIDVNGTDPGAHVLDVERFDASPAMAADWTKRKLATKPAYPPIIYCNRSNITAVFNAMASAGLQVVKDFRLWIATLDGKTKRVADMTGVTAVQWLNRPGFDESIVYDDKFLAVVPPPPPPPAQVPPGQWLDPNAWTWASGVTIAGLGLDGKHHAFQLTGAGTWAKVV